MSNIAIKRLLTAQEFNQAVELQKDYWGNDASNLVPRHVLHTICHHGGHLLGAYLGSQLVGFVMGFSVQPRIRMLPKRRMRIAPRQTC